MMYPFPEHVAPALVLLLGVLTAQFEAAVPGATAVPYQGYRTHAEQTAYFAQGRQTLDEVNRLRLKAKLQPISDRENKHPITLAGPSESAHTKDPSPAVDMMILCRGERMWSARGDCDKDGVPDYRELGLLGERLGLVWGGRWRAFPDVGHLELGGQ
jgi:peptidoglycan L-alanyl-D-glutamate endopeptidase CwlK